MPSHTKSKLQTVLEESSSAAVKNPSVTTAVKNMASVLLGPRGKTPIESMLTMQHYQLWGFILIVVGIIYIVWLMQKKLDSIEKQYKEQFVLLHRLFKSHQDLQVEVRKKPVQISQASVSSTTTRAAPSAPAPSIQPVSLDMEEEEDIRFDEENAQDDEEDDDENAKDDEEDDGEDEREEDDEEDEREEEEEDAQTEEPEEQYEDEEDVQDAQASTNAGPEQELDYEEYE